MKLLVSAIFGFFALIATVQAEDHSAMVCAANDNTVCAHVGYHWGLPTSTAEAKFVFHATPKTGEISDLKIDLWMDMGGGHGHGSAPVVMAKMDANKYQISNAFFVMPGTWLVRADFNIGNEAFHLDIPVDVAE